MAKTEAKETSDKPGLGAIKPQVYVVKAGDSLSKIAKALLGDDKRWPEILKANADKIKDADQIKPGLELVIPKK